MMSMAAAGMLMRMVVVTMSAAAVQYGALMHQQQASRLLSSW